MLIDWYTVVAQVINFLILVFLLKRFLYGRIIAAMDRREQRIADRLKEADEERAKAQEEAHAYRRKNEELDRRRSGMMAEAKKEVESRRAHLMEEAQSEVTRSKDGWYEAIERERETFLRKVREQSIDEVTTLVRKILIDLADADLEGQVIRCFVSKIKGLNGERADQITAAAREGDAIIRSAFPVSPEKRTMLRDVMDDRFGGISPAYVTDEGVGLGIVLEVPGIKLGWTVKDYLSDLEQALERATQAGTAHREMSGRRAPGMEGEPVQEGKAGGDDA
jgi:F-type H+-transporting ATPase subunit b